MDYSSLSDDQIIQKLEWCLDRLAFEIERSGKDGEIYFPLWERLEHEIELVRAKQDKFSAIRDRIQRWKVQS
ncbi:MULTISPECIES: hypothetical protein [unclassified Phyllobacterium]|uniref:hypothetical protein n=1 Tax=unclassified Phyllobacterium TaxID=2638441 RepID=UPI003012E682